MWMPVNLMREAFRFNRKSLDLIKKDQDQALLIQDSYD